MTDAVQPPDGLGGEAPSWPTIFLAIPLGTSADEARGWAEGQVGDLAIEGAIPPGPAPAKAMADLLVTLATSEPPAGYDRRVALFVGGRVVSVELAVIEPEGVAAEALTRLVSAEGEPNRGDIVSQSFQYEGREGAERVGLWCITDDGVPADTGAIWASTRSAARHPDTPIGPTDVLAWVFTPDIETAFLALQPLRQLVAGTDLIDELSTATAG